MRKKTKRVLLPAALLLAALFLAACGNAELRDGVYAGRSGEDDTGAWAEVSVTISQGKVQACKFISRQKDGTVKGEDYGKINGEISNRDFYEEAQLAVAAMKKYNAEYLKAGNLDDVQAVSGATNSYNQFLEAVDDALKTAKK
ncbi:MAG: FMN-binding protein [Treponema sp.]|jgi:major membrane immunogen (membrane-anchored lipoprotein)|nr:FMN-binding protein [Treponema sp.]